MIELIKKIKYKLATKKVWVCHFNGDTCEFCKRLHGQVVDKGDTFSMDGYELDGSPAHKGCNCDVEYI